MVKVIIGANYGDEGKGHMTQYFAKEAWELGEDCIGVLSNGGSQRGHTVRHPVEHFKYVFKHMCSGTFANAETYIPKYFICEPRTLIREVQACTTPIYVDPESMISTPYDIYANQLIETLRGEGRHGSCGMGIWETVKRNGLKTGQLLNMHTEDVYLYLRRVRDYYLEERLKKEIPDIPEEMLEPFYKDKWLYDYIDMLSMFGKRITLAEPYMLRDYDNVLFENAQGLLLNQKHGEEGKYTTPSNTGLKNPAEMISELCIDRDVEVCYVTRTYLTRHGNGPMENEGFIDLRHRDLTNVENDFQGKLRTGLLDQNSLCERIDKDFYEYGKPSWKKTTAVTWCDEPQLYERITIPHEYASYGPMVNHIRKRTGH